MINAMLDAALALAKKGLAVFPAKFVGKQKLGCTSAEKSNGNPWGYTRDPDEIRTYWKRWPNAAIGLPTGAVNGFFVLDLDTKAGGHDHDGEASLQQLVQEHRKDLPVTRGAFTPTGGMHLYYKQPPKIAVPCSASNLGPGIDVRGDGGFVIAPPSVRPRVGAYEWRTPAIIYSIKVAPSWLLDLLVERQRPELSTPTVIDPITCDPNMLAAMQADCGMGLSNNPADVYGPDNPRLKLEAALAHIPADIDYGDWFRIACAIYAALGDDGFSLFDRWSSESSTKYKGTEDCERKWQQCAKVRAINPGTIYWLADQYDPGWRNWYRRLLAVEVVS